jgi:heme exporter protein A
MLDSPRSVALNAANITKRFGLRDIFTNLSFSLNAGETLAVTGRNGSGKSTLLKVIANVTERGGGAITFTVNGNVVTEELFPLHIGFVAPYLQLYGEFTAWEHAQLVQRLRGLQFDEAIARSLFENFGLAPRRFDLLRTFSSGMTQRVKYICALIHNPSLLLLDEPMTNLDEQGIMNVRQIIQEGKNERIIMIATNAPDDLSLATHELSIEKHQTQAA